MSLIDKIKAHSGTLEPKKINVPEWDQSIYIFPLSVNDGDRIEKHRQKNGNHAAMVWTLLICAKDQNGEPLFKLSDREELFRANMAVVTRVANEVIDAFDLPTDEEAEKN